MADKGECVEEAAGRCQQAGKGYLLGMRHTSGLKLLGQKLRLSDRMVNHLALPRGKQAAPLPIYGHLSS